MPDTATTSAPPSTASTALSNAVPAMSIESADSARVASEDTRNMITSRFTPSSVNQPFASPRYSGQNMAVNVTGP